jgi:hypothetical protein
MASAALVLLLEDDMVRWVDVGPARKSTFLLVFCMIMKHVRVKDPCFVLFEYGRVEVGFREVGRWTGGVTPGFAALYSVALK